MAKHDGDCDRGLHGGRGRASVSCRECVAQVEASVVHAPDCEAAFGRRDLLHCGRCRALAAGVPPARSYRALGRYSR